MSKAHPDINDTLREQGPESVRARHDKAWAKKTNGKTRYKIEDIHKVFRKWLDQDYDIDVLDAVLAAAAAERLTGDPLWLLVISGPGNAKTETVQALAGAGATITSTIASEGALLSATKPQGKGKGTGATGGLLRKLGDRGILVIKDVTTILSADRHTRGPVLAAIREIYDGRWERNVGSTGGLTLTWTGRLVIVGAVTTAWDSAHSVIAAMGDRFVIIRADIGGGLRGRDGRRGVRWSRSIPPYGLAFLLGARPFSTPPAESRVPAKLPRAPHAPRGPAATTHTPPSPSAGEGRSFRP
jgi:hypothetical protein